MKKQNKKISFKGFLVWATIALLAVSAIPAGAYYFTDIVGVHNNGVTSTSSTVATR